MSRWTEEEERVLRKEYPTSSNLVLSQKLGRSIGAIENKASRMGLRKEVKEDGEDPEKGDENGFDNSFELIGREEALKLDKIDLLRINWSLAFMYQKELNNPNLSKSERHKLMNALSNHTAIINSIRKGAEEELEEEEEDLQAKLNKVVSRRTPKGRRIRLDKRRVPITIEIK